jgi:hypothetical protein
VFALGAACLSACTRVAKINDVAVPMAKSTGYRIASIGGAPPTRSSHPIIPVVPFVEVPAGRHRIEITPESGSGTNQAFDFTLAPGVTYRIGKSEGSFTLVEDK